jgi:hypothetical protein
MDLKGIVKDGANFAVLNAVMNLRIKSNGIYWVAERLLAFEGLRFMEMACVDKYYSLMTKLGISNISLGRKSSSQNMFEYL